MQRRLGARLAAAGLMCCIALAGAWMAGCGSLGGPSPLTVTAMDPRIGSTLGSSATISGTGFGSQTSVRIGGVPASSKVLTSSSLHVDVPPHSAGHVDVTVSSEAGTVTLGGGFTYAVISPPVVTEMTPTVGSTAGGFFVHVAGTGFVAGVFGPNPPGTVVTVDGVRVDRFVASSSEMYFNAAPHAPGPVEIVLTNDDGQSFRVPGGYTFAPPESFDFNGTWVGAVGEISTPLSFTVQNDHVIGVSCGTLPALTASPAPAVSQGAFVFDAPGLHMTGRIIFANSSIGDISGDGCAGQSWSASKQVTAARRLGNR